MSEDVNLGNPLNQRHDEEERNAPHVTPVPPEALADDLFDDTVGGEEAGEGDATERRTSEGPDVTRRNP